MKSRHFIPGIFLLFLFSVTAFSQCVGPQLIAVADGRLNNSFPVDTNGEDFYFIGSAGHSYSVEVADVNNAGLMNVFFDGPSDFKFCRTQDGAGIRHTESLDPVLPTSIRRVSFTVPFQGGSLAYAYGITVRTSAGATQATFTVSDTTMYSPRWSTFSSFTTQWGLQNTTAQPINATLIATATIGGTFSGTLNFTIPANSQVFKSISPNIQELRAGRAVAAPAGLGLTTDTGMGGFVVLTHDGPPGAILADAFFSNGQLVVPTTFQAVRASQH